MAVFKKSVRKKLSKSLAKLVKKHGAEMTLALLSGIVSSLAAERDEAGKTGKAGKAVKKKGDTKADRKTGRKADAEPAPIIVKKTALPAARPVVVRKRAER